MNKWQLKEKIQKLLGLQNINEFIEKNEKRVLNLESDLDAFQNKMDRLEESIDDFNSKLGDFDYEVDDLSCRVDDLETSPGFSFDRHEFVNIDDYDSKMDEVTNRIYDLEESYSLDLSKTEIIIKAIQKISDHLGIGAEIDEILNGPKSE